MKKLKNCMIVLLMLTTSLIMAQKTTFKGKVVDEQNGTLLIVGQLDVPVIKMNKQAFDQLLSIKEMEIIPGASHLFEEPGKLMEVADMAIQWYKKYMILD
ncbi:MAG: hypothetical protein JHC39_07125 [Lentimicrobium sp.]|jgi:hypothetical protein|nr:hypothetical protein [Lentimicrobium sp.]